MFKKQGLNRLGIFHSYETQFDVFVSKCKRKCHGDKISAMSELSPQDAKKLLRARLTEQRLVHAKDPSHPAGLNEQLLSLCHRLGAKTVAAYLPFGGEPNISVFVSGGTAHGLTLIMPVANPDGTMHWVHYTGQSAPGIFGFDEPVGPAAQLSDADLILIPASAVDLGGNRLGKGKGFYDVALAHPAIEAPVAAVVYEAEVLESLPTEEHDQPVGFIVTPSRVVTIG
jgi:5-formyltetrahydrofolate cyclo-ligase